MLPSHHYLTNLLLFRYLHPLTQPAHRYTGVVLDLNTYKASATDFSFIDAAQGWVDTRVSLNMLVTSPATCHLLNPISFAR